MLSEHKFPVDVEGTIRYRGWKVVLACFGLAIAAWSVGFYGHGLYLVELQRLHQWPTALISSATSFYYLFSSFLMIFLDIPLKAIGPRNLAAVGVVLLALPLAALGKIVEPWQLFAAYFVMAFGWTATGLAGITSIVGPWFERRRGLAISLALNGASVAGIIATPLLVTSTATYGFDTAAEYMAGVILLILLPAMLLLIRAPSPERAVSSGSTAATSGADSPALTRIAVLRSWRFWSIAGPSSLALTAQVGFLYHLVAIVEARFGRGDAATAMAVTAICGFSGRMALGTVIDRLEPRLATAACVGTQGLALILLLGSESRAAVFASSAVFGSSIGNVLMLPILTVQRELPPAAFGKAVGLSTAIAQFAFSVGPGVLGLLRDWTGSYSVPLLFCVSLQAAACMVALAGRRRQTRAEARHRSGSAEIC